MAELPEKKKDEGITDYTKRIASWIDKLEKWFWYLAFLCIFLDILAISAVIFIVGHIYG
jgi:hypothetical protein